MIRGLQKDSVVLMVDGMRLNSAQPAGAIASFLSLGLADRVEVVKGTASVLYGGANPGGIINLVSKRPTDEPFGYFEAGINNFGNAYLGIDVGTSDKQGVWSTRLTGKLSGGDQYTDYSKDFRGTIMPQITYQPNGTTRITAYGAYSYLDQVHSGGGFLPYVGTVVNAPASTSKAVSSSSRPKLIPPWSDNQTR